MNVLRSHRPAFRVITSVLLVLACTAAFAAPDHGTPIKVMTRNLYQGTDFTEAMGSTDFIDLLKNVTLTINNVRATNPPARMAAVAQEIADQEPDLVALQEATVWQTGPSLMQYTTEFDPVQLLLTNLAALKQPYKVVTVYTGFDFASPGIDSVWVHTTMQNVILARQESLDAGMTILNTQTGTFATLLPVFIQGLNITVPITRGWAYADVDYNGQQFRFLTAHPEAFYDLVEEAQVFELLTTTPTATPLPVIMAADFNARADDPTQETYKSYSAMLAFGFADAWHTAHPGAPGFSCCQDNKLFNKVSKLNQRIDLVMTRGPFDVRGAKLVGNTDGDRILFHKPDFTLWPSDHAGLAVKLRLP
jgi:endonuclease/exonuclease/phosphatase family metal-dependent hydrolase